MNTIFLGTGTSQGVPVVGCSCVVCSSSDKKDARLRSSIMFIKENFHLLIDIGPDLRQQLLSNGLDDIDAVLISHEHNDHVSGIDDIRPINFIKGKSIPIYTLPRVISELKNRFYYAFEDKYAAKPKLSVHAIDFDQKFEIGPFNIQTIRVNHGNLDILGFIIDDVAYLTDVKSLDKEAIEKVKGCRIVILSALHKKAHHSHQNLSEALLLAEKLKATQHTYITHIAHLMGVHEVETALLPKNVSFAYDGLSLSTKILAKL